MDENTRDLLISAYRRKTLAAVHVDLQNLYHHKNDETFTSVAKFAGHMRVWGIPNVWVTFPIDLRGHLPPDANYRILPASITTVHDFNKMAAADDHDYRSMIPDSMGAHAHEPVVIKNWGSAFRERVKSFLDIFLRRNKMDTIIIDGVDYDACLARTLNDGTALDRYNFIAVRDCINLRCEGDYKDHLLENGDLGRKGVRRPLKDVSAFQRRFHSATSEKVLDALLSQRPETATTAIIIPPPTVSAMAHVLPAVHATVTMPTLSTALPPLAIPHPATLPVPGSSGPELLGM